MKSSQKVVKKITLTNKKIEEILKRHGYLPEDAKVSIEKVESEHGDCMDRYSSYTFEGITVSAEFSNSEEEFQPNKYTKTRSSSGGSSLGSQISDIESGNVIGH